MGDIRMSEKERRRLGVMERVEAGNLKLKDAAVILGMSYRQAQRVRARHKLEGDLGLVHRSRGRKSNRGFQQEVKDRVLCQYRETYAGFGPTLFRSRRPGSGTPEPGEKVEPWFSAGSEGQGALPIPGDLRGLWSDALFGEAPGEPRH
jgi:hypothetical protein